MLKDIIEGCFIITSEDLVFEVKGVLHPENRIIAYLRYVPDISDGRKGIRKIYDLRKREEYLKDNFPHYLWYSKARDRILQSVPRDMIKSFLNPVEHLNQMSKKMNDTDLSVKTVRLANILTKITGISKENIGITGSQLVGVATETSDIDLVVYGAPVCRKFYDKMKEIFDQVPEFERYSGELLDSHVLFRWEKLVEYHSILREIERKKILQGIFDSYHFFIRLVKLPCDIEKSYGTLVTKMRGSCEIDCMIKGVSDSIFTPCEYTVESLEYPEIKKFISYRGRFTEQLPSGVLARVRGRLEDVTNTQTGETYQQVVLGEFSSDYLVPM